jgi:hypothetical protein
MSIFVPLTILDPDTLLFLDPDPDPFKQIVSDPAYIFGLGKDITD